MTFFWRAVERDAPDLAASIGDVRAIVGFRNIVVPCYDTIDPRIVWDIVLNKLPAVEEQIEHLLEELDLPDKAHPDT